MARPTPLERELLGVYRDAEAYLLLASTRAVAGVVRAPAKDEARRQAEGLRAVQAASVSVVDALNRTAPATIVRAIRRAAKTGGDAAARELAAAVGARPSTADRNVNLSAIDQLAATVVGRVQDANSSILRTVPDAYRRAIAAAVPAALVGVETRRDVSQRAWWELTQRGITGFTDKAGRRWRLSSYVEMAARTAINRAEIDGRHARLQASGHDLVMVIGSGDRCPKCRPWHAEILSLSGRSGPVEVEHTLRDGEMLTVDVSPIEVARAAGWGHPQCRCSTKLWLPGVTKPDRLDTDDTGYQARQRQRAIERDIRAAKERADAALDPTAEKSAKAHVRAGQARMRDHLAANPTLLRLTYREQIGAGNIPTTARRLELDTEQRNELPAVADRAARLRAAGVEPAPADTGQAEAAAEADQRAAEEEAARVAAEQAAARRLSQAEAVADYTARVKPSSTAAERRAVNTYTGVNYRNINMLMRGQPLPEEGIDEATAREQIAILAALMARYELPGPVSVRRYLNDGVIPATAQPGEVITPAGFTSTSMGDAVPAGLVKRRTVMEIDAPAGMNAIIPDGLGVGVEGENELILPPDVGYRIESIEVKDGKRWVRMTAIPPM